jgi:primary-amine oxidase
MLSRLQHLGLAALLIAAANKAGCVTAHPLDPLSAAEITTVAAVLRNSASVDATIRYALIDLDEPIKHDVLAWKPGQPFVRKAFIIARRDRMVYEGIVDLTTERVERWQAIPNVESAILSEEVTTARRITTADPGWQEAMRKRGLNDFQEVFCAPLSAGYSADAFEAGRRLVKVTCFAGPVSKANVWDRPIEGLYAVVDLDARKVIRLIDDTVIPVASGTRGADERAQPRRQPAERPPQVERLKEPKFVITGNQVQWKKWSFHYRMDERAGLVISLLRYDDDRRRRMVLYRGSVAEMFVPYMDSDIGWSFRNYMDVGEFGLGSMSSPLTPGIDCPANAAFLDAILPDDRGNPVKRNSTICLFERDAGAPMWRHFESVNGRYQGRPTIELVLRTIPSIGNYDYVIDWVLNEAGTVRIDVGATGIDQVKGVRASTMQDPSASDDTAYGEMVASNLVGTNHDHFLSFRLDIDIDDAANTLVREKLVTRLTPGTGGRLSLWQFTEENISAEGPLTSRGDVDAEIWRIINPNLTNRLGQHPGYELRMDHTVTSILAPEDHPQQRAAFSASTLWITAYDPKELYAAGMYPNQSRGGDGLPAYVAQHRAVANADIVVWYTMGFHHLPWPEDWPILPTMWHSVSLVPCGFFSYNPDFEIGGDLDEPRPTK